MFRFSTRSDYDKVDRWIKEKKFYATLPHKIDAAIDAAEKEWPFVEADESMDWMFEEELEGETPLGGEMRVSYKFKKDTTD